MSKKILLIDIPNLFYRAFFAIPRTLKSPSGEPTNAIFGTASMIISLIENEKPDFLLGFRDEREKTFRHEQDAAYKAHRPEMPSDLAAQMPLITRLFSAFNIPIYSLSGYEADDCIATAVQMFHDNENEIFIVSGDQDLFGLVKEKVFVLRPINGGKLIKMDKDKVKEKLGVFPEQVADLKAIAGDTSDNLPGIPGIGHKGAADLISQYGNLENIIRNVSEISGRKGQLLKDNINIAIKTKLMTQLHYQVPVDINLESGNISNINWNSLVNFFREMRFNILLSRIEKSKHISEISNISHDHLFNNKPNGNFDANQSYAESVQLGLF